MDYELKGNVTTVVAFVLMPVLAGFGVDNITSSAIAGIVATLVCFGLMYLNERYLSGIFTKSGYQIVRESPDESAQVGSVAFDDTTPESAVNPEYEEGA